MTKQYGLLGGAIEQSLSPQIHQSIYRRFKIDASYQLYRATDQLADTFAELKHAKSAGFNVTTPHKRAIVELLDGLTKRAQKINAVNTVKRVGDSYIGDNTDAVGFGRALAHNRLSLAGKTVLVVGAGGAASAVIDHLIAVGAKMILIYNRTRYNTNQLMIRVKQSYRWQNVMSVFDYHGLVVDAIVNSTPLGGPSFSEQPALDMAVVKADLFIDLVYYPAPTITMQAAQAAGMRTLGGCDMLVYQALEAAAVWHDIAYDATDAKEIIDALKTPNSL